MSLSRPGDSVGPVESGVEPLRAIRSRALAGDEVIHLVVVSPSICLASEVTVFPTPVSPGASEATEQFASIGLSDVSILSIESLQLLMIGLTALKPDRHSILRHLAQSDWNASLPQILLSANLPRDACESRWKLCIFDLVREAPVRVTNLYTHLNPIEGIEGVRAG